MLCPIKRLDRLGQPPSGRANQISRLISRLGHVSPAAGDGQLLRERHRLHAGAGGRGRAAAAGRGEVPRSHGDHRGLPGGEHQPGLQDAVCEWQSDSPPFSCVVVVMR